MSKKMRRYWSFQLIGWGSFAAMNMFFAISFNKMSPDTWYRVGIVMLIGILGSHGMRELIIQLGILHKTIARQVAGFFFLSLAMSVLISLVNIELISAFGLLSEDQIAVLTREGVRPWLSKLLLVLYNGSTFFILFFIWNLIYFMYHYVTKSQRQQLDTLKLESLVKELELKTIKAHINPHFIFNSLNSIRALVDENPQRARKAVTELSNILRNSLQADKQETVPFEQELLIVKDYLALENMRFEDRLRIEYNIDDETLLQPVPPMMLQTLVENAIKHGISKQISGGVVKVSSDFKGGYHELSVQNTGHLNGFKPGNDGFGISSTNNRLSILYGEKAKFAVTQLTPTLVEAKVLIPVNGQLYHGKTL